LEDNPDHVKFWFFSLINSLCKPGAMIMLYCPPAKLEPCLPGSPFHFYQEGNAREKVKRFAQECM